MFRLWVVNSSSLWKWYDAIDVGGYAEGTVKKRVLELSPSGRAMAAVQMKWQMAWLCSRVDKDISKPSAVLSFWELFERFPKSFPVWVQEMREVRLRCFPSMEQLHGTKGWRPTQQQPRWAAVADDDMNAFVGLKARVSSKGRLVVCDVVAVFARIAAVLWDSWG